jgi:hypothetical protein
MSHLAMDFVRFSPRMSQPTAICLVCEQKLATGDYIVLNAKKGWAVHRACAPLRPPAGAAAAATSAPAPWHRVDFSGVIVPPLPPPPPLPLDNPTYPLSEAVPVTFQWTDPHGEQDIDDPDTFTAPNHPPDTPDSDDEGRDRKEDDEDDFLAGVVVRR